MIGPSSKGETSLAQSFMQNQATQPSAQLPTITQPQQQGIPELPQQQQNAPVMGSMAPSNDTPNYLHMFGPAMQQLGEMAGVDSAPTPVGVHGMDGKWIREQTPGGYDWRRVDQMQQPQQQQPQMSQAQRLAQAINERAQRRG